MKKEFIYNIFFLIVTNLLVKPLYIFGIETKVQNEMGPDAYGLYFSLFGLVFLWQFINEPGIQNHNAVFLSQNKEKVFDHLPRLLGLKLTLFFVFIVISLLSALLIGHSGLALWYVVGITSVLFLSTLFILLRTTLSGIGKYRIDTWLSSIDRLLLILVLGTMFVIHIKISIVSFIIVQLVCYAICVMTAFYFLGKEHISLKPKIDIEYSKKFLKSCLPYASIILLVAFITKIDSVLIERMIPDGRQQAGLYAAGYRFVDAANMFGYLFGALLLPMYGNNIGQKEKVNELFDVSFRILFIVSITISFALYFFSEEVINLFYNDGYVEAIPSMKILMISLIPILFSHAFGPLLFASKKIKQYNIILILTAIINLIGNLIFIPLYKSEGAAITSAISQFVILAAMMIVVFYSGLVKIPMKLFMKCLVFIVTNFVIFYVFKYCVNGHWMLLLFLAAMVSLAFSIAIKMVHLKTDLLSTIKPVSQKD